MNQQENSSRKIQGFQSIMHLTMGTFYLIIGGLILYVKAFGTMELSAGFAYALGGLMLVYGVFRLWRGFAGLKQRRRG